MIIDVHTHIYDLETYEAYFQNSETDIALVMHWPKTKKLKEFLEFFVDKKELRAVGSLAVTPETPLDAQIDELQQAMAEKKIFALKLYPGFYYFYPSDPRLDHLYNICQKYKLPIIFHTGLFWPGARSLAEYARPVHIDALAVKYPDISIIISHFGFPWMSECAGIVAKNKNVYTDFSGLFETTSENSGRMLKAYYDKFEQILAWFPDVGDKIMFGTDFAGVKTPQHEIMAYQRLAEKLFTGRTLKRVMGETAEQVFSLKPSPVF